MRKKFIVSKLLPIASCCAMLLCGNAYAEEQSTESDMSDVIAQVYSMSLDDLRSAYLELYMNYTAVCEVYGADVNDELLPDTSVTYGENLDLSSSDVVTLQSALTSGKFQLAYNILKSAGASDEALNTIQKVLDIQDDLELVEDDFDNRYWYYSASNRTISKTNHVAPYIYLGNGALRIKLGFRYDSWLFFDHTKIKLANGKIIETKYDRYDDITTDTKGDGIFECADVSLSYEDLEALADSPQITIRFLNSDNQYLDYVVSTNAFSNIKAVKDCYDSIQNILNPQD